MTVSAKSNVPASSATPLVRSSRPMTHVPAESRVDGNLSVPKLRKVFVVGDAAASNAWRGTPVPGLAPGPNKEAPTLPR